MRGPYALFAAGALACTAPAQASSQQDWDTVSTVGALGLTALAIGLPVARKDKSGALQAVGAVAASTLITTGLKEGFPETRPDGSDRKSFPSGHTSLSFAAATTLYKREGGSIGIPALAVATLVGIARVKADKHHWYDCVIGAGIGTAAGLLITRHPNTQSELIPWGDSKGGGISFAMRF